MLGLTPLGEFHTAISLVALAAGAIALARDRKITWSNTIGKIYVVATIITCITAFGIFRHGGFGKGHVLGIITLFVLCIAFAAGKKTRLFGRYSPYVETVAYSMTFFFHLVSGITETLDHSFTQVFILPPKSTFIKAPAPISVSGITIL